LEHVIRAAGVIADVEDLVVIGSQAILGQFPGAPAELLVSNEADVFPKAYPERADLIDSSIGEGSPFQQAFGYYAHGVGESSAVLPHGWQQRLILVSGENTRMVRGWCLEVHDLAVAKLAAGREKDLDFVEALVRHGMIVRGVMEARLVETLVEPEVRTLMEQRLARMFGAA
jgi:hypothetical protein